MNPNENTIRTFYEAFQRKDYRTMQSCYTDDATFSDPVFQNLNSTQVKAMWEMFCVKSTDLKIEFEYENAYENYGSVQWKATYTFSKTGNKVVNYIIAEFFFENGKIKTHRDIFSFYNWSRQALGIKGLLLGWTDFLKRKVQRSAQKSLEGYMKKQR